MSKLDETATRALEAKIALDEAKEAYEEALRIFTDEAKQLGKLDSSLKAAGHARVKIVPNRKFNAQKAEAFLTKKALKECEVTSIDAKKLKERLTPLQVEQAMENYANPWKISLSVLVDD